MLFNNGLGICSRRSATSSRRTDQELNKDLVGLKAKLGAAFRLGKGGGIVPYFFLERMIEEFTAQGIVGPINANDQAKAGPLPAPLGSTEARREAAKQAMDGHRNPQRPAAQ